MQYSQPPQYVTHKAQQYLIQELTGQALGQAPHRDGPHTSNAAMGREQAQFFQSQRVFSSEAHHFSQLKTTQPMNEPHSAQMPAADSSSLISHRSGQNQQLQMTRHQSQRNNESGHQYGAPQNHPITQGGEGPGSVSASNSRGYATETSALNRSLPAHHQNANLPARSSRDHSKNGDNSMRVNPEHYGHAEANNLDAAQGKDFADMVSIEAANCSRIQQQQKYSGYEPQSTSVLRNSHKSPNRNQEIQTAIQESTNVTNYSNGKLNFGNVPSSALSKSLNFSRNYQSAAATSILRESQTSNSTREMPNNPAKNCLNHSAISAQAMTSSRKPIQMSNKDKNQSFNQTVLNGQKYSKQQPEHHLQKNIKAAAQKWSKSSERLQKGQKPGATNYSPFQQRLYQQYQSAVPSTAQNYASNVTASGIHNENQQESNQSRNYMVSRDASPDTSYCTGQNTDGPVQHHAYRTGRDGSKENLVSSSAASSSCLLNPQLIEQSRKDHQKPHQYQPAQMKSVANKGGSHMAKSQGSRATMNNTAVHESKGGAMDEEDKQRHNSATYNRENTYGLQHASRYGTAVSYHPQRQRGQPTAASSNSIANSYYQKYKEMSKAPQKNAAKNAKRNESGSASSIQNRSANNHKTNQNQMNKSSTTCMTARGPGPVVASGPMNPIGQKSPSYVGGNTASNVSYMKAQQHRQMSSNNQSGLANKIIKTASRKSLGLSTPNTITATNSKKQIETARMSALRGASAIATEDKSADRCTCKKHADTKSSKRTTTRQSCSSTFKTATTQGGTAQPTHRQKPVLPAETHCHAQYPKVSPKSASSMGKAVNKQRQAIPQRQEQPSNLRSRPTPPKTEQARKSKVSPFKTEPQRNHNGEHQTAEGVRTNLDGDHHRSPDSQSVYSAEYKYLIERQRKMVAQLSQNKLGSSNTANSRQQVPGLTLETINEKIGNTHYTIGQHSQTPKQQQHQNLNFNSTQPLIQSTSGSIVGLSSKTVRGNPPQHYQGFNTNQVARDSAPCGSQSGYKTSGAYAQKTPGTTSMSTIVTARAQAGDNHQGAGRKSAGHSQNQTRRDFVQENKKISTLNQAPASCTTEKPQSHTTRNGGAQSQGKTPSQKQPYYYKEAAMNTAFEVRQSHGNLHQNLNSSDNSATPKKHYDKCNDHNKKQVPQQPSQRGGGRADLSRTQYLTKKAGGGLLQRELPKSKPVSSGNTTTKSPSYQGFLATQVVEMQDAIEKHKTDAQSHRTRGLELKKSSKNGGLNMTINVSSKVNLEARSSINTKKEKSRNEQQQQVDEEPSEPGMIYPMPEQIVQMAKTHRAEEMKDFLRTIQSAANVHGNTDMFTFAQNVANGGTLDTRNPAIQQQAATTYQQSNQRSNTSDKCNSKLQMSECSRDQLLLQKQNINESSAFKPTAQNSNCGPGGELPAAPQHQHRKDDVQNILVNSHQSKNNNYQMMMSMSSKGIFNNSKLGKNTSSSHSRKNEAAAGVEANKNIVSFQAAQEKSQKSNASTQKKPVPRDDKENLHIQLRQTAPKEQTASPSKMFFRDIAEQVKVKKAIQRPADTAIETQNEEENKSECKAPNNTNVQQNIKPYLQAQKQTERQALAPQSQNIAQQPKDKNQAAPQANAQSSNILNDTMVFSQKSSLEEYIIGKQIGQGAYAVVRIGLHKPTNKKVALKIYKKYKLEEPNRRKSVKREIKLMEKMKHENIVQLYEIIDTSKYVILIMEYVGGGSLHGYLKSKPKRRLEEWDAKRIFKQIVEGLRYCHSRCITHRDIKLENLLLDDAKYMKIIDFGFSTCIPNEKKIKIFCGTPSYMAPEIVLKTEYCGPPADIWAMGVLLFTILSGQFPYRGATDEELYDKICRADYHLPKDVKETLSPAAKDLIAKLFSIDASRRPSAKEILEHQWLYNIENKEEGAFHNDSITQIQSSESLQIQKRAKSQRMDGIGAPKNKAGTNEMMTDNYVTEQQQAEKKALVNPFNVHQEQTGAECAKRSLGNIGQQAARSSSHVLGSSRQQPQINNKVIGLISAKLGYDPQDVKEQVRQDLLLSENKDRQSQRQNQTSFVGNLYFRLLDEEEDQNTNRHTHQEGKSDISASEQRNPFSGSDLKSQQKSDNGVGHAPNVFNQTQQLLMKSAISQTSLGMSGTGGNMHSQGFGQGVGLQNMAIQPSYVPSMKSLNSGGQLGTSSLSQLNFNNTLASPANFNTQLHQHQMNFNNTQPLKGLLQNLDESQYGDSTPDGKRDAQRAPLNFNQTNIFVTNNNQVFQDNDRKNQGGQAQIDEADSLFNMVPVRLQQAHNSRPIPAQQAPKGRGGLMVNNFFAEKHQQDQASHEQESPNFRKRDEPVPYRV